MSKLYVFGIGGTGARVIKSLTMLLASGVQCDCSEIVPIMIDPDENSGNLGQVQTMLQKYKDIRSHICFDSNVRSNFFKTNIIESVPNYMMPLNDVSNKPFNKYIDYDTMSDANKALMSMLFSDDNMKANMQVGFKGNPNIGSVVLNQFAKSDSFVNFANSFSQGDKIFIISSIFGGTGASGFPLLLKTLRGDKELPNNVLINNANIGAITVMPYFNIKQDENSSIDSSAFISKTKAALYYYDRNISDAGVLDYMYYIGDECQGIYDNCDGGVGQINDAHVIELLSALAIIDFAESSNTKMGYTVHKEYGMNNISSGQQIIFSNLSNKSKNLLQKPLTQFLLFSKYMKDYFDRKMKNQWQIDKKNNFDAKFWDGAFYQDILEIQDGFVKWLSEMSNNSRSFSPFKLDIEKFRLYNIVRGKAPAKMRTLAYYNKKNYNLFDQVLNEMTQKDKMNITSVPTQFLNLFYEATELIVTKKFDF